MNPWVPKQSLVCLRFEVVSEVDGALLPFGDPMDAISHAPTLSMVKQTLNASLFVRENSVVMELTGLLKAPYARYRPLTHEDTAILIRQGQL